MTAMKGYRTLIFTALMTAVGMLGWKVSPEAAEHWGDVFVTVWGIGAILLRQATDTPVGLTAIQSIKEAVSAGDFAALRSDVAALLEHVKLTPPTAQMVMAIAQKLDALALTLTPPPAPSNSTAAEPATADASPAPAAAPAPESAPAPAIAPVAAPVVVPAIAAQAPVAAVI